MTDKTVLERLESRASQADEMIALLRRQIAEVRNVTPVKCIWDESQRLKLENKQLTTEVKLLKEQLIQAEASNGVEQIPLPTTKATVTEVSDITKQNASGDVTDTSATNGRGDGDDVKRKSVETISKKKGGEAGSAVKKSDASAKAAAKGSGSHPEIDPDVGRLDMRVGLIVSARKHPDADSLYVEEVDLAEEGGRKRTVVSGLVRFVSLADMQNRVAVFLCNLKAAKMRGVTSEAMVMCASTPDKVEMLRPPAGSVPGDRVTCEGYVSDPDKELNPKKKIFERIAPDLKTNAERVATYKGEPLMVSGKGVVVAPSLANVQIK